MDTELRAIPSFPDYSVTADGRVYSSKRQGRWLRPATDKRGYLRVSLQLDGRTYSRTVHALVAEAFLGARPPGAQVCHNDGNPANNVLANLRYDTPAGNAADRKLHGTEPNSNKTHCPQGHPYSEENTRRYRTGRICKTCVQQRNDARPRKYVRVDIDWSQFRL